MAPPPASAPAPAPAPGGGSGALARALAALALAVAPENNPEAPPAAVVALSLANATMKRRILGEGAGEEYWRGRAARLPWSEDGGEYRDVGFAAKGATIKVGAETAACLCGRVVERREDGRTRFATSGNPTHPERCSFATWFRTDAPNGVLLGCQEGTALSANSPPPQRAHPVVRISSDGRLLAHGFPVTHSSPLPLAFETPFVADNQWHNLNLTAETRLSDDGHEHFTEQTLTLDGRVLGVVRTPPNPPAHPSAYYYRVFFGWQVCDGFVMDPVTRVATHQPFPGMVRGTSVTATAGDRNTEWHLTRHDIPTTRRTWL